MLRHIGSKRTPLHNLKLATLLGLTAGFVNAAGFLAFSVLTTNITGHAALFAEQIALKAWDSSQTVALWMFLFLLGAFISSLIVSVIGPNQRFSYLIPILIEIGILLLPAVYGYQSESDPMLKRFFAGSLLFAMGLQNSLVSMVSGSVVRTTHLTGTFTDLGIDLAGFFGKHKADKTLLRSRIKLRVFIIVFFMTGAVSGAYCFRFFKFQSFYLPVFILFFALLYDLFRIKVARYYRVRSAILKTAVKRSVIIR